MSDACPPSRPATVAEVELLELVPLGDEHDRVGALDAPSASSAKSTPGHQPPRLLLGDRVVGATCAPSACSRARSTSDVASRMSSVFGLKARPSSAIVLPTSEPRCFCELADDAPLLELVDLDDGVEELEVVAGVAGELLEGGDVLGKAVVHDQAAGGHERVRARHLERVDVGRRYGSRATSVTRTHAGPSPKRR